MSFSTRNLLVSELVIKSGAKRIVYPRHTRHRGTVVQVIQVERNCKFFPGLHAELHLVKDPEIADVGEERLVEKGVDDFRLAVDGDGKRYVAAVPDVVVDGFGTVQFTFVFMHDQAGHIEFQLFGAG